MTSETAATISDRKTIIEKSTVPVRTCDGLRKTLLLNGAQSASFSVVSNPEFLRQGRSVTDFLYPYRIVVGVDDEVSGEVMQEIYRPLTSGSYYEGTRAL